MCIYARVLAYKKYSGYVFVKKYLISSYTLEP